MYLCDSYKKNIYTQVIYDTYVYIYIYIVIRIDVCAYEYIFAWVNFTANLHPKK